MAISSMKSKAISSKALVGNAAYNPFLPTDISGIKLWLDAADTSTITLSGSQVTQWNDKSGNGYNFAQSTAGNRPLSGTRTINSKNVIDFDGTDDRLVNSNAKSVWTFMHSADSTFFWAGVTDTTNLDVYLMGDGIGTGSQRAWEMGLTATGLLTASVMNGINGGSVGTVMGTDSTTSYTTSPFYASLKSSPSAATASRGFFRYKNGANEGSNAYTASASGSDSPNDMSIGMTYYPTNTTWYGPFNGGMGEIIVYNSVLSDADMTRVQNYLAAKWGM
jgi:hypothetical protein